MPSALGASRDFMRTALARVRSGMTAYGKNLDRPGPGIKVEPFDAQNVTAPAALIKVGTSIAAARRARANYRQAEADDELARERLRAQIALIRAQEKYALGEGRQGGGGQVLGRGPYAGWTPAEASSDLGQKRLDAAERARRDQASRSGRVAAAQAGLRQLDDQIERDAQASLQGWMVGYAPSLQRRLQSADAEIRSEALQEIGINPTEFMEGAGGLVPTATDRARMIREGFDRVKSQILGEEKAKAERRYKGQRQQYQSVIDESALTDQTDPLGLNPLGLDLGEE